MVQDRPDGTDLRTKKYANQQQQTESDCRHIQSGLEQRYDEHERGDSGADRHGQAKRPAAVHLRTLTVTTPNRHYQTRDVTSDQRVAVLRPGDRRDVGGQTAHRWLFIILPKHAGRETL